MQVRLPRRTLRPQQLTRALAKQANAAPVEPPSWRALGRVAAVSAVPFIGFGFCDNSIMVRAAPVNARRAA